MPALSPLSNLPPDWKVEYEAAFPQALSVAQRLPLVRVVLPSHTERRAEEALDVFSSGVLKRSHKSPRSTEIETRLAVPNSLYFHAGRPHPDYGSAILVLGHADGAVEATPFGLGALDCNGTSKAHSDGACLSPVAHWPIARQEEFVRSSRWSSNWRDHTAEFLALYFANDLHQYFAPGSAGRPVRRDPEGICDEANKDWRSWTIEVRLQEDLDLRGALEKGLLLYWAMESSSEEDFHVHVQDTGYPLSEIYPLLAALPPKRRVHHLAGDIKSICAVVQDLIHAEVLG